MTPLIRLEQLFPQSNPFALVTAAHLQTQQTKHDTQARYTAKRTLVRLLYQHGWSRQRVLDLFAVLDWMMRLPDGLERQLWRDIEQIEGETRMKYVTSVERLAIQLGEQQGEARGKAAGKAEGKAELLTRQLIKRFGPLSIEASQRLQAATADQLDRWADRILDAPTLAAVFDVH